MGNGSEAPDTPSQGSGDKDGDGPRGLTLRRLLGLLVLCALMLFGAVKVAEVGLETTITQHLQARGVSGRVQVNLGRDSVVRFHDIALTRQLADQGLRLSVRTDQVEGRVDLFSGLTRRGWLREPIRVSGLEVRVIAETARRPSALNVHPKQLPSLQLGVLDWCGGDCRVIINQGRILPQIPGLVIDGWGQFSGRLALDASGALSGDFQDFDGHRLSLEVPLGPSPRAYEISHQGRLRIGAELAALPGIVSQLPGQVGDDIRISGTVDELHAKAGRIEVLNAILDVRSSTQELAITLGGLSTDFDSLLDPAIRPQLELEGLSVAGFGGLGLGREVRVRRARFGDKPMALCASWAGCPDVLIGIGYRHTLSGEDVEHLELEVEHLRGERLGEVGLDGLVATGSGHLGFIALKARRVDFVRGRTDSSTAALRVSNADVSLVQTTIAPREARSSQNKLVDEDLEMMLQALSKLRVRESRLLYRNRPRDMAKRYRNRLKSKSATGYLLKELLDAGDALALKAFASLRDRASELARRVERASWRVELIESTVDLTQSDGGYWEAAVDKANVDFGVDTLEVLGSGSLKTPSDLRLTEESMNLSYPAQEPEVWLPEGPIVGEVGLELTAKDALRVWFSGQLPQWSLAWRQLALQRIDVPPYTASIFIEREPGEGHNDWLLTDFTLSHFEGATTRFAAELRLAQTLRGSSVVVSNELPEQDCGALHRAVPAAMLPGLENAVFRGQARLSTQLHVPFHDIYSLRLRLSADFSGCIASDFGGEFDVSKLNDPHAVFEVYDHRLNRTFTVGPGTRNWWGFGSTPAWVWGAAMATEDFGFFGHRGFSRNFIERALRLNFRTRRYAYGGSTITQQLVKNLFLTRRKTLARKLTEAVLVWQVERHVTKHRILSLYLNCIEYGPRIYGIRAAARKYFGTGVSGLRPIEAAYLMNLKPFPWAGHYQFIRRQITPFFRTRTDVIKSRLLGRSYITDEQAELMQADNLFERFQ